MAGKVVQKQNKQNGTCFVKNWTDFHSSYKIHKFYSISCSIFNSVSTCTAQIIVGNFMVVVSNWNYSVIWQSDGSANLLHSSCLLSCGRKLPLEFSNKTLLVDRTEIVKLLWQSSNLAHTARNAKSPIMWTRYGSWAKSTFCCMRNTGSCKWAVINCVQLRNRFVLSHANGQVLN